MDILALQSVYFFRVPAPVLLVLQHLLLESELEGQQYTDGLEYKYLQKPCLPPGTRIFAAASGFNRVLKRPQHFDNQSVSQPVL